jgi:hypothetical protein
LIGEWNLGRSKPPRVSLIPQCKPRGTPLQVCQLAEGQLGAKITHTHTHRHHDRRRRLHTHRHTGTPTHGHTHPHLVELSGAVFLTNGARLRSCAVKQVNGARTGLPCLCVYSPRGFPYVSWAAWARRPLGEGMTRSAPHIQEPEPPSRENLFRMASSKQAWE